MSKKQDWSLNSWVKVGFLTLKVIGYDNNEYILESAKGVKYSFEPYHGLVKI